MSGSLLFLGGWGKFSFEIFLFLFGGGCFFLILEGQFF